MKIFVTACSVVLISSLLSACGGGGDTALASTALPPASGVVISGTAIAASGMVADSDVNDPSAPYASNDLPASAQSVPSVATVTGYASATGSGPAGSRFASVPDELDTFRATLAAGQVVALSVSQWNSGAPNAVDLDLFLFDAALVLVASSEGIGSSEDLLVPSNGEYFIVIGAASGASTYELQVGAASAAGVQDIDHLSRLDDFVEDEIVVTFKTDAILRKGRAAVNQLAAHGKLMAGAHDRPMLIENERARALSSGAAAPAVDRWSGKAISSEMAARIEIVRSVKALRGASDIAAASPNYRYLASAIPNDPGYRFQWHYPLISLPQAWDITTGVRAGSPVIVAVVDTGVWLAHEDLQGQLLAGYDFIRNPANALDGNGIDANPDDPGDQRTAASSSWHGTHVAGTVAASTNNGLGVAGVAAGARIMPIRVLGRFGGESYDINQGIRYAAGLANDSGSIPPQKADVINLSLGGPASDPVMQATLAEARSAGVIVIAAAGNESTATPKYPAAYPGVVSVSAVDMTRSIAPYSNFGASVDIAAPGGNSGVDLDLNAVGDGVASTIVAEPAGVRRSSYEQMQGTSMAAPHVAGVAALMRAVAPQMTPAQFDALLASGALTDEIGISGRDDQFGYGLVNAWKAVTAAQTLASSAIAPPVLLASPSQVNFGAAATQVALRLENGGNGTLNVVTIEDDAPWLSSAPQSVDAANLGTWGLVVNRTGLAAGAYSATITITTNLGTTSIPVSMTVQTTSVTANAGRLYFLLVSPTTFETAQQTEGNAVAGAYPFSFSNVAPGSYLLIAGADLDNDDFICGAGEACGAWPLIGQFEEIAAATNVSGLSFTVAANGSIVANRASTGNTPGRGFQRLRLPDSKELR